MRLQRALPLFCLFLFAGICQNIFGQHDNTIRLSNALNELKMFDYSLYLLEKEMSTATSDLSLLKLQKAQTLFRMNKTAEAEAIVNAIPQGDPHYLYSLLVFGMNAIEKGQNELGIPPLEQYVNSFSAAKRPQGDAQRESFRKAVYYLKHAYTQLNQGAKAVAVLEKLKLLEEPDEQEVAQPQELQGRELKLQQYQAKLDAAEVMKYAGLSGWQTDCTQVIQPLKELMWVQDMITAYAFIERARAQTMLGKYKEALAELESRSNWNLILAFDEPFKNEGMLYAAPSAKAYLWRGRAFMGLAEQATDPAEKQKNYISAIKSIFAVLKLYDSEKCPFTDKAYADFIKIRDILKEQFDKNVKLPPGFKLREGTVDTSEADRYFVNKDYERALPLYSAAFLKGRNSDKVSEITYKLSYCYLQTGKALEALALAWFLADYYPGSNFTPVALLQIGEIFWDKRDENPENLGNALFAYDKYIEFCPTHEYADAISARVAKVYYDRASELATEANTLPQGAERAEKAEAAREAFKNAIPMYRFIVENYAPTDLGKSSFRLLAWCYTNSRQFKEGAEIFLQFCDVETNREDRENRNMAHVADAKLRAAENFMQEAQVLSQEAKDLRKAAETALDAGSPAPAPEEEDIPEEPAEEEAPEEPADEPVAATDSKTKTAAELNAEAAKLENEIQEFYQAAIDNLVELLGPWREEGGRLAGITGKEIEASYEKAYSLLGWAYDGAGEKGKASLAFADFIKRYPDPEGQSKQIPKAMFMLATIYLEMEKVNEAGQVLETLSAKYPEEGEKALPRLARAMYKVGRYDKAVEAFQKIVAQKIELEIPDLMWAAARLWDCEGSHPKEGAAAALNVVQNLIGKIKTPNPEQWLSRAQYDELKDDEKALAKQMAVIKERLLFQGANAGFYAQSEENAKIALEYLNQLLKDDNTPYYFDGRFLRAKVNRSLKQYDQAEADYGEISSAAAFANKYGLYFEAQCAIGETLIEQENWRRALGAFNIIAKTDLDEEDDESVAPEELAEQMKWIEYAIYKSAFCAAKLGLNEEKDEMIAKYRKYFSNGRFNREMRNLPGRSSSADTQPTNEPQ